MSSRINASPRRRRIPTLESLENRQLLSLTVDLRLPGGGKAATVTGVGQVINLEIWATAKGSNTSTSDEALQVAVGSLLSSNVNGGAANGTLKASPSWPFGSLGSQSGASRDLDGDGDLDVGSNVGTDGSAFWAARSGGPTSSGVVSGSSKAFKVGTATFTVTSLKSTTGQTNLVFRTRNSGGTGALWWEDGNQKRESTGTYNAGSPLVLKRSGGTTPTGSASISGVLYSDTDKDGQVDSGESRLSSRKMFIDANKNGTLDTGEKSTYTNSSGVYTFSNLGSGTYRIRRADMPKGYAFSSPSSGYHDVTVSSTQAVTGRNFGVIPSTTTTPTPTGSGTISGVVFDDLDKDGQLDSTDKRLGYRKMYIDANKNGQYDSGEKTATTNSSGVYTFSNLGSGTYRIRRADVSSTYTYTVPSSGYYDILLGTNATVTGRNFGFKLR